MPAYGQEFLCVYKSLFSFLGRQVPQTHQARLEGYQDLAAVRGVNADMLDWS